MAPPRKIVIMPSDSTSPPMTLVRRNDVRVDPDRIMSQVLGLPQNTEKVRKRQSLHDLTIEQKVMRRKARNRISAQIAREKKKERTQNMEQVIKMLSIENEKLRRENEILRIENDRFRMYSRPCQENQYCASIGSAAFINAPRQRVQVRNMIPLLLSLLLTISCKKTSTSKLTPLLQTLSRLTSTSTNSSATCRFSKTSTTINRVRRRPRAIKQLRRIP